MATRCHRTGEEGGEKKKGMQASEDMFGNKAYLMHCDEEYGGKFGTTAIL